MARSRTSATGENSEPRILCLDTTPGRSKLAPRALNGVLVGYSDESKGYRLWLPDDRKVVVSRDVKFTLNPTPCSDVSGDLIPENRTQNEALGDSSESRELVDIDLHNPVPHPEEMEDVNIEDQGEDSSKEDNLQQFPTQATGESAPARGPGRPGLHGRV